ncbi:hypothetical protein [Streptomyces sp. enrichment culture]|uniref:hypothetical protein n=1 Tax=Streptomyces sp. enrichment culture TaxID=1795815 RepID=UPI003F542A01
MSKQTGPACGNNPNHKLTAGDRQAVVEFRAYLTRRAALLEAAGTADELSLEIEQAMKTREIGPLTALQDLADKLRRRAYEAALSPYYEHPECGFHWHGRDGMDVPMRDGQPVCPRCELRRIANEPAATAIRAAALREAADFVGNDDVCDCGGCDTCVPRSLAAELRRMADETAATETPWPIVTDFSIEVWEGDTWVGVTYKRKTIEEARERRDSFRRRFPEERFRIVRWDETPTVVEADPEPAADQAFVPPAHYRRDDGVDCCVHAIPIGPNSCRACRELADAEAAERQDGAQPS